MPAHFFIVFIVVIAIALFSKSWAGVAVAVVCLLGYYARQYYRLVIEPKRRLTERQAQSSVGSEKEV